MVNEKISNQKLDEGVLMKKIVMLMWLSVGLICAEDFEVRGSMVYDAKTELLWQKRPSTKKMKWQEAKAYCKSLELRLPNLYELKSLVDYAEYNPAIRTKLIEVKTDDWYWSSSEYKGDSSSAWAVYFGNGYDGWSNKTRTYYVLCVSGQ